MHSLIERHREAIRQLSRSSGISRLEVFGSAATDEFDPERSDVDFIVAYPPDYDFGPWLSRHFELREQLEALLGTDVDLVMPSALKNRWFRREADRTRTVIYDASEDAEVA